MKTIRYGLPLLALLIMSTHFAQAQGVDAFFGVGTATASATGVGIDTFGDGNLYYPPKITGLFLNAGGDFMFSPHYGVGAETEWRAAQGAYAGLKYRPTFYDFNFIWHPIGDGGSNNKRVVPELQAGLGAVNLKYYYSQQTCDNLVGCSTSNTYLESSNHFQVHMSAGVKLYVMPSLYLKPEVNAHWVNNFFQFGTSWVPEYDVAVGYTFGRK